MRVFGRTNINSNEKHPDGLGTIHLVYPNSDSIAAPYSIGRHLQSALSDRYRSVVSHNWTDPTRIRPSPGDVLIGHPHPDPWTVFRRSSHEPGWARVLILAPYAHGSRRQIGFLEPVISRADLHLAITGSYWFDRVPDSPFAHWYPKMVHLDLAVDRSEFPPLKDAFARPGDRGFLYIGSAVLFKNPKYLSDLARRLPGQRFSWVGAGRRNIPGFHRYGWLDFRDDTSLQVVREHDFLITVGTSDANPATILEAMAWGLIPVCTPQSGYEGHDGIINVPANAPGEAAKVLDGLQYLPETGLKKLQALNWKQLDRHFNWSRFANQVIEAIESRESPPLGQAPPTARAANYLSQFFAPYSPVRPRNLHRRARALGSARREP